jgi:hypothetical protein
MNLNEIITAVENGQTVCWSNAGYQVIKDSKGQFLIKRLDNNYSIGLTWADNVTLNGKEKDFYILEFDYNSLFNPNPKPAPEPVADAGESREEMYKKSRFCKVWAATYAEAVAKTVKQYVKAKKEADDWASRDYSRNMKPVLTRAWNEYERRETTVYEANERRRNNRVRAAKITMQQSIDDLRELGLSNHEIKTILAL